MSNISRLLTPLKPKRASFLHHVGVTDHELQKAIFNDIERKLLQDVINPQNRKRENLENQAWGRYIQRNTSPQLTRGFSKTYQDPSTLIPAHVKRIPYKHFSLGYTKMKAVLELMSTTGFYLFASVGNLKGTEYKNVIIERQIQDFESKGVQIISTKPVLVRACLWYLSESYMSLDSANLDDFWIKGISESRDLLSDRLKQLSKDKEHNGQIVGYFFNFDANSATNLEHLFQKSEHVSNFLGCHITQHVIRDSQHLKKSFNLINDSSALAGEEDQQTHDLAKVLQVLASSGMVKSTVGPGGGILLTP